MQSTPKIVKPISGVLLQWYDCNARELPWRIHPEHSRTSNKPDAYHVWLSEIMAQQTQLVTVMDYYAKFLAKWPDLESLANAELEEILSAWAGLGYYSRARNLKKCADIVFRNYGGKFPVKSTELKKLPGIGEYTAAAIAAICFDEAIAIVDGNVERVICRLYTIDTPIPKAKSKIRNFTQASLSHSRPGDFGQAMMDLGAIVCTPKNPMCEICPLTSNCDAARDGHQLNYPVKIKRKPVPLRHGAGFVAFNGKGEIYLRKRADDGMLAQMSEIPTSDWGVNHDGDTEMQSAPFEAHWEKAGIVHHSFTHFKLALVIYFCDVSNMADRNDGWWAKISDLDDEALPTLMKKAIELAIEKRELSK